MEWLSKKSANAGMNNADVVITKSVVNGKIYFNVRFLEKVLPNISRNGFVRIAIDGTRVYFDEADFGDGWKLQQANNTVNKYLKIKGDGKLRELELGSYNLKLDVYSGYYYIDTTEKLEKQSIKWESK